MVAARPEIDSPPPPPFGACDHRTVAGILAGVIALVLAILAAVLDQSLLLLLAALAAVVSVLFVLTAPDVPLRYRDRKARRHEAERLTAEADAMAVRAARFEAEAIMARKELAAAMMAAAASSGSGRADDDDAADTSTGDLSAAPGGSSDATPGEDPVDPRRQDDPPDADWSQARDRTDTPLDAESDPELAAGDLDPSGRITDLASGVFNQLFFDASLDKRVSAARRGLRPLTLAFIEVVAKPGRADPVDPKPVADIILATLREADTVARADDGLFVVLLEDTPENGAIWTLERVRRHLTDAIGDIIVRAGVSCYPASAFEAHQLLSQARVALEAAREWNQDRIEVSTADPEDTGEAGDTEDT